MRGVVGTRIFFPVIFRSYVSPGYSLNLGLVCFGLALLTLVNLRALDGQQKLAFYNFFFFHYSACIFTVAFSLCKQLWFTILGLESVHFLLTYVNICYLQI